MGRGRFLSGCLLVACIAIGSSAGAQDDGSAPSPNAKESVAAALTRQALDARADGDIWGAAGYLEKAVASEPTARRLAELGATYWMGADALYRSGSGRSPGGGQAINNALMDGLRTLNQSLEMEETASALIYLGLVKRYMGRPTEGYRHMERAIEKAPRSPLVLRIFGKENLGGKAYEKAEKLFVRLLVVSPDDAEAHFLLGQARYNIVGKADASGRSLVAALKLDPTLDGPYRYLSGLYLGRGLHVQMLHALDEVIAARPEARRAARLRARTLAEKGEPEKAVQAYEALIESDGADEASRIALAYHLAASRLRRFDEAVPHLMAILDGESSESARGQSTSLLHWMVGDTIRREDFPAALRILDAWCRAEPENGFVWANRGATLRRLGNYAEAARSYESARAARPFDPQVPNDLALVRLAQGKVDRAIVLLNAALEIDADHLDSLENLGILARARGDLEDAARWFRRAYDVALARDLDSRSKFRRYLDLVSTTAR